MARPDWTHGGRWGVRQIDARTGEWAGGTTNCGWSTRREAEDANPPTGNWRYEIYDRWPEAS